MLESEVVSSGFFCGEVLSKVGFPKSPGPVFLQILFASQNVVSLFTQISTAIARRQSHRGYNQYH